MKDRKVKAKHPWMKYFVLSAKVDPLEKSQSETRAKLSATYTKKKSSYKTKTSE